jgi:ceramide glucosyltransferase
LAYAAEGLDMEIVVGSLVFLSFAVLAAMEIAKRRLLRRPVRTPGAAPAVSILKPMRGADPALEANLESVFRLDYPEFEVVLGTADADDPALEVARRVAARHPHVPSRIVADSRRIGVNPKVNNLANLLRRTRHDLLLVSDSNVALPREYLADLVAHHGEGVGLVTSVFRGAPGKAIGARLEALQIDTFVAGGIAIADATGKICVVGKSMLFTRRDLGRIGGFRTLARYLAEDQVCGEEMAAAGLRVAVARTVIENRLGDLTLRAAASRHLRWARIRRTIHPVAYAAELLLSPVACALVAAVALRSTASFAILAAAAAARIALDAAATQALGNRVDALLPVLSVTRDLASATLWPLAWLGGTVRWRGNVLRIGPRSLLEPVSARAGEQSAIPIPAAV